MAETRSIPTALGIVVGPAIAYVSYLLFQSGVNEYYQLICFGLFLWVGYELGRSRLSLSGALTVLLLPSIPVAIILSQDALAVSNHLSSKVIIAMWAASILLGTVLAGINSAQNNNAGSIKRLAILAIALLLGLAVRYWLY